MCLEEEKESKSRIWIDRALRGTPNHFSSCFQHSYVLTIDQRYSVKPAVLISVLKILVTSKFFVLKPTHLSNMLFFSFFFKSKFKSLAKYCLYGSVSFVTCLWSTGSIVTKDPMEPFIQADCLPLLVRMQLQREKYCFVCKK